MKTLLVSGAILRENGFELGEGKYYKAARLFKLDLATGKFSLALELSEGNENYPDEDPNLQFTAPSLEEDVLWLPTDTEIYKYRLPDFNCEQVISHPCFQNVHSVHCIGEDLVATSTGLDNVVVMDKQSGEVKEVLNTEGKDPWHRFNPEIDYRQVHSTRPHDCHPNYVFEANGNTWVTRCKQEDIINLNNPEQTVQICNDDPISIHDGIRWKDKIVFTRVDGLLVFLDLNTMKETEIVDPFKGTKQRPAGWSRGLFIHDNKFYIGYSKLRKTKLKDKLKFLAKGNVKYSSGNNALVVEYDFEKQTVTNVFETEDGALDAIYGIVPFNYD